MIPGPDLIFKCPKCGQRISRGSLTSGNTIGAVCFSDASMKAPMCPRFPAIAKCAGCGGYVWLGEENAAGSIPRWPRNGSDRPSDGEGAIPAEFLTAEEYIDALNGCKDKGDIRFLRIMAWQAFNARYLYDKDDSVYHDKAYIDNCNALLSLLKKRKNVLLALLKRDKDENDKLLSAELHRNLGEFDECLKIIETVSEKYSRQKNQIAVACEKKLIHTFAFTKKV